jgi:hypothetical protein
MQVITAQMAPFGTGAWPEDSGESVTRTAVSTPLASTLIGLQSIDLNSI